MKRKELLESREYWIANIQLSLYEMMENYMKDNKLNKTQLADKLDVSKGYISQVLNGDFDHKISKLVDTAIKLRKVPIIKYEDMDKYIMHDSLNISTTIGFIRDVDISANLNYGFAASFTAQGSHARKTEVQTTPIKTDLKLTTIVSTDETAQIAKKECYA